MSTMYDALKKAESARRPEARLVAGARGLKGSPGLIAVLVLGVVFLGILGWDLFRRQAASEDRKAALARLQAAKDASAAAQGPALPLAAETVAVAVRYPPGTYILEGIVNAGAGSMAVINGRLLKINEGIDALVVRKVSAREVELSDAGGGRQVILKLQP